jgi:hypothetical protein
MTQVVIGTNVVTLADWASRVDPEGRIAIIAELLAQKNEVIPDMHWEEGNLPTGHRIVQRTGLPSVMARSLNQGITPSKSTTTPVDEACAFIEGFLEIDRDIVELNGHDAAFRMSEADGFIESMNQAFAQILMYGDPTLAPAVFRGFAPRLNGVASGNTQFAANVLLGTQVASTNTSIWLVCWGPNSVYGIFPKGSKAGLIHEDLGLQVVENVAGIGGARMMAYREHWQWKCGLAVADWRYVVRAQVGTTIASGTIASDLINLMSRMIDRLPSLTAGRCAFYMNRTIFSILKIQALAKSNQALSVEEGLTQIEYKFLGIPLRKVDQILNTEASLT